ncbi:MAG: carbohydrate-binding protein, partial [Oscillospiraceae bacterium]|nr:carbohydrate-binding protein [Oscillospiraceae bacterium]
MGWTTDEQWGLYSNNEYYTVQYSVLGPADSWGGHSKGLHGFGIMMGKGYLTFDHNLIIHNVSRNFRGKVEGQSTADFTNNIIYDWGYQTAYGTIGHLNYVNNTLKAGNSTTGGYHWMYVDSGTKPQNFKVYCDGNRMINKDGSLHAITNDNWSGVTLKTAIGITMDDLHSDTPFQTLVNGENVSTATTCESAENSYEHVITYAGNGITPTQRTKIDQQCADETRNGTGQCSGTAAYDASQSNLDKYNILCGVTYEYPAAVTQKTITDNDNDGMDDEWEELRGLNPNDPTDINGDYCGQGYTNIEYYINDLTVGAFPEGVVTLSPETAQLTGRSAFEQIEAEAYDAMEGIRAEDTSDATGGQNIGFIENGDYVMYKRLDFQEGAHSFTVRASGNACTMELYLDSLDTPVVKIPYSGTGSFGTWEDVTFNIPSITGIHNLYIKFTGGDGYLMNLNHFVFSKEAVPMNGKLIKNLLVSDMEHISGWALANNTAVGSLIFGDRPAVTYTEVPAALADTEAILTACDSKNYTEQAAAFTASENMIVYIGLDSRVENVPAWMSDYIKTNMVLKSSNDVTFEVYQKTFAAGDTVNLGANGQSYNCMNYTVNVSAASS